MLLIRNILLLSLLAISLYPVAVQAEFKNISARDAQQILLTQAGSVDFQLLDVRTDQEYSQAHIEGAHKLDFYSASFAAQVAKLDRNKTYLLYCKSGVRSARTLAMMRQLGFISVYNMRGGILNWYQQQLPLVFQSRSSTTQ